MFRNHPQGSSIKRPIVIDDEVQVKVEAPSSSSSSTSVASTLRGDPVPEETDRANVQLTIAGFGLQIYLHGEAIGLKGIAEMFGCRVVPIAFADIIVLFRDRDDDNKPLITRDRIEDRIINEAPRGAKVVCSSWIDKLAFTGKTPPFEPYEIQMGPAQHVEELPNQPAHQEQVAPRGQPDRPKRKVQFVDENDNEDEERRVVMKPGRQPLSQIAVNNDDLRTQRNAYLADKLRTKPSERSLTVFLKGIKPKHGITSWDNWYQANKTVIKKMLKETTKD